MAYLGTAATDAIYDLAEGVIWDDRAGLLRWVDIWAGRVLSGRLDGGRIVDIAGVDLGQTAGAVALADDGGLLVAAARGLATIAVDGTISFGPDLLGERGNVRLNDGTVDPQGRYVVGSLSMTASADDGEPGHEELLRVSADGAVETLRTGVRLSNGIAFSPDGTTIYHVDTFAGTVSSHQYGPGPFAGDVPWTTVLDGFPHSPDGLTVSADGDLWVAQFGGSGVRRHAPTGELVDEVTIDAAQATCPGFVGPGLGVLAITSAQEGLDDWSDHSGAVFLADLRTAHPATTGIPLTRWPGSTSTPYWKAFA